MGRLNDRLAEIKEKSAERIPAGVRSVMERANAEIRESGRADRVPRPGSRAPRFARPTPGGETVRLGPLLDEGPVVLSFFRGRW